MNYFVKFGHDIRLSWFLKIVTILNADQQCALAPYHLCSCMSCSYCKFHSSAATIMKKPPRPSHKLLFWDVLFFLCNALNSKTKIMWFSVEGNNT